MSIDKQIRIATFNWLSKQVKRHGDVLNRDTLAKGFQFKGTKIPLVSPQGIFKPKQLDLPLSITTTTKGPYKDIIGDDFLHYKYRGKNPRHRDNLGLRNCMQNGIPLIYFHGIVPSKYLAVWPVYIVGDDPDALTFRVAADNQYDVEEESTQVNEGDMYRRAYLTSTVKQRLHQRGFRERVMAAYQSQCTFCQLKHAELLDAAHIIPDQDGEGIPSVNNGLALCKIHHAAFDQHIIGVTPDYQIKVKEDVLREKDGPMLKHGIQELQDHKLILPKSKKAWPNQVFLDLRYQKFRQSLYLFT